MSCRCRSIAATLAAMFIKVTSSVGRRHAQLVESYCVELGLPTPPKRALFFY
jgi:hypothetical protein